MSYLKMMAMSVLALVALFAAACSSGVADKPAVADATATPTSAADGQPGAGVESFAAADGNFVVLISDEENAIGDFAHLWVYIDRIGVQVAGEETAWLEFDVPVENQVVDLTQFVGDDATSLVQTHLPAGDYQKIFVRVEDVEGELVTGETVSVKLPSSRLKLNQPFTVGGDEVTPFVFDISVIAAGNANSGVKYILKPIVGESGSKQSFAIKHEKQENDLNVEVLPPTVDGDPYVVIVTDEAGAPVAGAAVEVEVELEKLTTDAEGLVTFAVPANAEEIKAEAELGEAEGEIRLFVGLAGEQDDEDDEDGEERLTVEVVGDLIAGSPLTLRVTDATGAVVVGAEVEVEFEIAAGTTLIDGTLTVDVPVDAAKVEAEARTEDGRGNSERKGRRDGKDDRDGARGDADDESGESDGKGKPEGLGLDPNADEHDDDHKLLIGVEGDVVGGGEVVIVVTDLEGTPVEGAAIEVDDAIVGSSDADGRLTVSVPTGEHKLEIDAKLGEAEGELEVEF